MRRQHDGEPPPAQEPFSDWRWNNLILSVISFLFVWTSRHTFSKVLGLLLGKLHVISALCDAAATLHFCKKRQLIWLDCQRRWLTANTDGRMDLPPLFHLKLITNPKKDKGKCHQTVTRRHVSLGAADWFRFVLMRLLETRQGLWSQTGTNFPPCRNPGNAHTH